MHTRRISDYGGVANTMPWLAAFWILFSMANSGLPGTSGFVGEFMIILASFQQHPLIAFAAATTLMIGAGYSLWLAKRVIWGDVGNGHVAELKDINSREWIVLGVFAAGVLLIGIWPKPLTDLMEPSIAQLAAQLAASKLEDGVAMIPGVLTQGVMNPQVRGLADIAPLAPELLVVLGAFALLMLDLFLDERRRIVTHVGAIIVLLAAACLVAAGVGRSEEHTSELQSLMRISYAVFCLN